MGHHGNPGAHQGVDRFGLFGPAFELYGLSPRLLQDAAGKVDRLVLAEVVAGKRHIDHHQGPIDRPPDHFGVVDHLVERHRQRVLAALDHHAQTVADQNPLDSCLVQQSCRGMIVRREHRNLVPVFLEGGELGHRNTFGARHERETRKGKQ